MCYRQRIAAGLTLVDAENYNRFFPTLLMQVKHTIAHGDDLAETIRAELTRSVEFTSIRPDDAAFREGAWQPCLRCQPQ